MRLTVNLVTGGKYVRAGDELPSDFVLPEHLDRFAIYDDDQPQISQGAARLSAAVGRRQGVFGTSGSLAKSAANYPRGEEKFIPEPKPTRGTKMGEEIRRAHQRKGKL